MLFRTPRIALLLCAVCLHDIAPARADSAGSGTFERLAHNAPEVLTDLAVGLWGWPFPFDVNADGKPDMVLISGSSPYRGTYYFENTGERDPHTGAEVFKKGVYLGSGHNDFTPSYLPDGSMKVLGPGFECPDFLQSGTRQRVPLNVNEKDIHTGRLRGKQWSYIDYDQDGVLDLIVGIGDWSDYDTSAGYDSNGHWLGGDLHGYVYWLRNAGTNAEPRYESARPILVNGEPLNVYGMPSPVFGDFLHNGKQHLICGEFVDGITFFENIGTAAEPIFAEGKRLRYQGEPLAMPDPFTNLDS